VEQGEKLSRVLLRPCTILNFDIIADLNNTYEFSPYLKENTTLRHYKDQLVNAV
jgi:hypothetical protein